MDGVPSPFRSPPASPARPIFARQGTPSSESARKKETLDRFIPPRTSFDAEYSNFLVNEEDTKPPNAQTSSTPSSSNHQSNTQTAEDDADDEYNHTLKRTLLQENTKSPGVLPFKSPPRRRAPPSPFGALNSQESSSPIRNTRKIPTAPDRILDIPDIVDDYYLNLLDWSRHNVVAIALSKTLYLWNATTGATTRLFETESQDFITSLRWSQEQRDTLAVGLDSAGVQLWDTARQTKIRDFPGHSSRVSSLSWTGGLLSSGSRDTTIRHHDARAPNEHVATLRSHTQEVCGLQWSPNGLHLASGGNDNMLYIWDARQQEPRLSLHAHKAAVKALAWCPHHPSLLASGGGTADRRICFWNVTTGSLLSDVDTKSQVCALQWSVHDRQLVSSHGFTHNQLILWKHHGGGRVSKVAELTGHTARVLHMAQSPDGTTIVSASGDETLRFWRILGSPNKSPARLKQESSLHGVAAASQIR